MSATAENLARSFFEERYGKCSTERWTQKMDLYRMSPYFEPGLEVGFRHARHMLVLMDKVEQLEDELGEMHGGYA